MTKRIATFFLTCVLVAGCCLPALAEEAAPSPVPGPSPETASSAADNTDETAPGDNTDSNINQPRRIILTRSPPSPTAARR